MTETKEIRKTITTIFIVPTLKIPREGLINNGFLNGFSKDGMRDVQYKDAIYLLFRPNDVDMFREFLDKEFERTKHIIDDYDYPNGFVVVVYKLNTEYSKDFALIRRGMYSKTSSEFQGMFPEKVEIVINNVPRKEISLQCRVFKKTKDLVKFWEEKFNIVFEDNYEVWDGYKEENETLTEEKLKEYEQ